MASVLVETKEEIIEKVVDHIDKKISAKQAKLITSFAKQLYITAADEDLSAYNILDLYGATLTHWNFINSRQPGETKIHIYNPSYEQHGWQSTHTIIEVISDDMPFLVDSLRMELNRQGFNVHLMIHRGGLKIKRNGKHQIVEVLASNQNAKEIVPEEAFIYVEIDRETDPQTLENLHSNITRVLTDVRIAFEDWEKMRKKLQQCVAELEENPPPIDAAEISESKYFLRWLENDHFTFLGCRDYDLVGEGVEKALQIVPGSGLGVLRDSSTSKKIRLFSSLPPEARNLALSPEILIISKTNTRSTVHRPAYTDYIGVKRFDKQGKLIGERRFIGLYTSAAYNSNPKHIPFLRHKVAAIIERSHLPPNGHAGKALLHILETLPRDDLFQGNVQELYEMAMGILHLQERLRIRLFVRKDPYGRFLSCLVYLPREQVNTELRQIMQDILAKSVHSNEITFATQFSESILARIHFIIRLNANEPLEFNVKDIEAKLVEAGRTWQDELQQNLVEAYGEEKGNRLARKYANAFPAGYRDDFVPRTAVYDIEHIEKLSSENPLGLSFYRPLDNAEGALRFKLFQIDHPIPLSDVLPILENMGLRVLGEKPHELVLKDGTSVWINDFGMMHAQDATLDVEAIKDIFQESFQRIWHGEAENDGFNRLVLSAQLNWRQISILRAYAKYLKQIGFTFSQTYIEQTLAENSEIARKLVELFQLRLDPAVKADAIVVITELEESLQQALDAVISLDEDRILRRYLEIIYATLRTNYFQKTASGDPKLYLSFKFNPSAITEMPAPRPMFEIFVYSPRFEAVHLRSAKVARGGIRWSDRREDFRTEVLGLMKAQKVKNAVIVPSGAKGGFVPKCLPIDASREALMEEVINCYKTFIRGMLDITDNLKTGVIVPPVDVVRYDEEDPYLVVAADKGTATFSDIANAISKEYDFWLGDAFASGGSAGYDHKKMGITARGAWESVKRHFRELGHDTQTMDFTVIGIGDMSGDVFGNGMLLSRHIKLIGAFNHLHIFLDPNPDSEKSFRERERLFKLPRSSWEDYDNNLISQGGGVYRRSAKSIKLSPEAQQMLGLNKETIVPNDLIRALLTAKVDLLFNGGIGTYVKAEHETHTEVGDRANDAIRINGKELRARVVTEGGNLGFTQLGRVEYELNGGRLYTDFIDNSAGVDCSDHEVNIKILLNNVIANGDLTEKQRNKLLADMTDDVARLVLRNNYEQTQAISVAAMSAFKNIELYRYYIQDLEAKGKLDRALEFLPDEKMIIERKAQGKGLTRPEIAVLLAYTKITVKEEILNSDVPEDAYLSSMLETAFPAQLSKQFRSNMEKHSLRREIIATQVSNAMINEMGITFVYRLYDETGATIPSIVRAYSAARIVFGLPTLWQEIEKLDLKVPAAIQYQMMAETMRLVRRATRWFLRHRRVYLDILKTIQRFGPGVTELTQKLPQVFLGGTREKLLGNVQYYVDAGVPAKLATRVASSGVLFSVLDIIEAASQYEFDVTEVASVYFALSDYLELGWFRDQITEFPVETHWDALAREAIRDDLDLQQRDLSIGVLQSKTGQKEIEQRIAAWVEQYKPLVDRWQNMLADLRSSGNLNFTKFSVAVRELLDLTQTSFHAAKAERREKKQK